MRGVSHDSLSQYIYLLTLVCTIFQGKIIKITLKSGMVRTFQILNIDIFMTPNTNPTVFMFQSMHLYGESLGKGPILQTQYLI